MAIESRLARLQGDSFTKLHRWAIEAVGFAAAAVLGQLEFLDATQQFAGQPVATRARLISDLEGTVGQRGIDEALKKLVGMGWVGAYVESVHHQRNITQTNRYFLNAEAINSWRAGNKISVSDCIDATLQKCNARDCKTANKNATPVYTRSKHIKEEEGKTPAAFNITSDTHPCTLAALTRLATTNHLAKPGSNAAKSEQQIKQALCAAQQLSDHAAAAIVDGVGDRGGWLSEALAEVRASARCKPGDAVRPALKIIEHRPFDQQTAAAGAAAYKLQR